MGGQQRTRETLYQQTENRAEILGDKPGKPDAPAGPEQRGAPRSCTHGAAPGAESFSHAAGSFCGAELCVRIDTDRKKVLSFSQAGGEVPAINNHPPPRPRTKAAPTAAAPSWGCFAPPLPRRRRGRQAHLDEPLEAGPLQAGVVGEQLPVLLEEVSGCLHLGRPLQRLQSAGAQPHIAHVRHQQRRRAPVPPLLPPGLKELPGRERDRPREESGAGPGRAAGQGGRPAPSASPRPSPTQLAPDLPLPTLRGAERSPEPRLGRARPGQRVPPVPLRQPAALALLLRYSASDLPSPERGTALWLPSLCEDGHRGTFVPRRGATQHPCQQTESLI